LSTLKEFLGKRLRLKINEVKSAVSEVWKREFLGFKIQYNEKISLSEKSEKKLKDTVRQLTKRTRGMKLEQVIESLNQKFDGWVNYFKIVETPSRLRDLDSWIRRKLRCYRLKQRKRCYPIVKFLMTLGVSSKNAWRIGKSSKGWWRLSHTGAVNNAMSNDWFEKLGLISLEKKAALLNV
jgi:RNA-directed DNA polymerase